jgi:hypothetical protein
VHGTHLDSLMPMLSRIISINSHMLPVPPPPPAQRRQTSVRTRDRPGPSKDEVAHVLQRRRLRAASGL